MVDDRKVPEGWRIKKLSEVAPLQRGFDLPTGKIKKGSYPVVYSNGISNYHNEFKVKGPGVITGRSGTIGKVHYADDNYWPHNTALWVTDFKDNNPRFIYYLYTYVNLEKFATGSGVPTLNRNDVHSFEVLMPSCSEQKAIATALTDTDNLITSLEKLIDKKKKIKQGTMQELLTGKKRLPGFSGEWSVKKLGEVSDIRTGKRNNQDKVFDGMYPFFVRSQDVERINTYSYDCEAILVPGEGGIGNIYHYIDGKFEVHQRVYKISNFSDVAGKFVYYYMKQSFGDHAMKNTVKATVDSLRLPTFEEFELKIPKSFEEQKSIAEVLTNIESEIDALELKLEKYKTIKQGMMQELLTGRIRLI